MNEMQTLECPKCGSEMRSYERNGVTVDQCTGCRGIFLDRGELERLVDAEGAHYEREFSQRQGERRDEERGERHREERGGRRKSKRKSFLENLMEMGGD